MNGQHALIDDMVRRFARERLAPLAARRDRAIEPELFRAMGELGSLNFDDMALPREAGRIGIAAQSVGMARAALDQRDHLCRTA